MYLNFFREDKSECIIKLEIIRKIERDKENRGNLYGFNLKKILYYDIFLCITQLRDRSVFYIMDLINNYDVSYNAI